MVGRTLAVAVVGAMVLGSFPVVAASPTRTTDVLAAGARSERAAPAPDRTDFNRDGFADLAIGAPFDDVNGQAEAGVVHVIYGSSTGLVVADAPGGPVTPAAQVWHQDVANVSEAADAGDRFGWALASGDFDGDGFADLAISAPLEDDGGFIDKGGVNILNGSPTGLVAKASQNMVRFYNAGAQQGWSLAALEAYDSTLPCHQTPDRMTDLAIGVPGHQRGHVLIVGGSFLRLPDPVGCGAFNTRHVGLTPGSGAGHALATGDFDSDGWDDVAVGAPLDDVEEDDIVRVDAGAVTIVSGRPYTTIETWVQGEELEDVAEAGDHVGASLAAGDTTRDGIDELFIGAPGEDLAAGTDAGLVHFIESQRGLLDRSEERRIHEDSNDVPGTGSDGDRFGSALAIGDFGKRRASGPRLDVAIGSAADDVVGVAAGAVVVLYNFDDRVPAGGAERWHQNSAGLLDAAEAEDGFGSALSALDFDNNGFADLAIGIPIEGIGDVAGAGSVSVLYGSSSTTVGLAAARNQLWSQGSGGAGEDPQNGDRFGHSLP